MARKICVITGSRAEYGLLRWVMEEIRNTAGLQLQVAVTGSHLAPEYGATYREIENDGFAIDSKVEMLVSSDTSAAVSKSMGLGLIGFGETFARLRPDLAVVLGDRFEILPVVAAALVARIPVAHLHGGESTVGAFDDSIRHAITKMAHLHFVAAAPYRDRVIQMGESPDRVFVVGAPGIDNLERLPLLDRPALERELGFALGARSLLVTFHPATLAEVPPAQQMAELLAALETMRDTTMIFTMPNADPGASAIRELISRFVGQHQWAHAFESLGQLRYLSCMRHVDGVVGNSSSGLIEAPALRKGTVNIGDRQQGRIRAASVIDCAAERNAIAAAIVRLSANEFRDVVDTMVSPFGTGGASRRVVEILSKVSLNGILRKQFHDL